MSVNVDDIKIALTKNRYIIYSQWWQNLMMACRILFKVEINAKDGPCRC